MGKRCKGRRRKQAAGARQMDPLGLRQQNVPSNLADTVRDISLFAGCESAAAARTVLRDQIRLEADAMATLVEDADAFDVIELMRLRELPPVPDPRAAIPDSSALAIEIVAAVAAIAAVSKAEQSSP